MSRVGEAIVGVDDSVAAMFHSLVTPPATAVLELVTALGSTAVLIAVVAVSGASLLSRGARSAAAFLLVAFAGAEALTWSLKFYFERERPSFANPIATESSFSFPSGHALISVAVYGAVGYLLFGRLRRTGARAACVGAFMLLVAAIGFSRLYLGVHYLSDVLAGFGLGFAWLVIVATLRERVAVHPHATTPLVLQEFSQARASTTTS